MKVTVGLVLAFFLGTVMACQSGIAESISSLPAPSPTVTPEPEPIKPSVPRELLDADPAQLCRRLAEIEILPGRNPTPTDPIYEALLVKGHAAIPCLVERIGDEKQVPDPRYSVPHWQHYTVGDTAVFILIDIVRTDDLEREKLLIEMLPAKYQDEWTINGIYAYFNYVSEPKNRKELQSWWKKRLDKK